MFYSAILFLIGVSFANGLVNGLGASPHNTYVNENICQVNSIKNFDIYTNIVKLQCEWRKFVDAIEYEKHLDPGSYEASLELNQKQHVYDFEFIASEPLPNETVYTIVDKNMFRNFRVKSLSLKGLGIKKIDYDTFSVRCCSSTLETLDLSNNKLARLDSTLLSNLRRLERIDLSNNQLQFGDRNFEFNKNLRIIDLSNNDLQYLPARLFFNLHELEYVDLSNNYLTKIDSCTFNKIQTSAISRQYSPTRVYLSNNPIDCNCDLFYLNRYLNLNINLTCNQPGEYSNRKFIDLKLEDPSVRCLYPRMEKECNKSDNMFEIIVIIVLACLAGLFLSISICCLCKNMAESTSMRKLKEELEQVNKPRVFRPKPNYVNSNTGASVNNCSDKKKLLP